MTIFISLWSAQHPNAGRNIQQVISCENYRLLYFDVLFNQDSQSTAGLKPLLGLGAGRLKLYAMCNFTNLNIVRLYADMMNKCFR